MTKRKHRHDKPNRMLSFGSTIFRKRSPAVGSRPGTLSVHEESVEPKIRLIRYDLASGAKAHDEHIEDVERLSVERKSNSVTWIDVQGFGNLKTIQRIGELFEIHPLALADMVNVPQRPKAETYGENALIITRMVGLDEKSEVQMEQVAVLLNKNFVITFQERYGDILDPLRDRIRDPNSRMRKHGSGYLMYAIVDTIVDGYYPVIDKLGDHLEELENRVMENPSTESLVDLNKTKNLLVNLRRAVWPQREAVMSMVRDDNVLISDDVRLYLRDTYDHCVQSAEVIEMYREMATGLINIYLSSVANRSNEVMKVLTVMASIFIPLTFMAGIYGMNFEHMPELKFEWAYPIFWGVMALTGVGMVAYFWRKGWIGKG